LVPPCTPFVKARRGGPTVNPDRYDLYLNLIILPCFVVTNSTQADGPCPLLLKAKIEQLYDVNGLRSLSVKFVWPPDIALFKHVTSVTLQHLIKYSFLCLHVIPLSQQLSRYSIEGEFQSSLGTSCQVYVMDWWSRTIPVKFRGGAEGAKNFENMTYGVYNL
jgi:hypothetical protein